MITITVDTAQLDKKLADFPARFADAQKRALVTTAFHNHPYNNPRPASLMPVASNPDCSSMFTGASANHATDINGILGRDVLDPALRRVRRLRHLANGSLL